MIGIIAIIAKYVLPAYAGMIPGRSARRGGSGRAPRVCGDDPRLERLVKQGDMCSPRMRG